MRFPLFISRRYLIAKKSHTAINFISGISIAGVTVGTMALIVVLSVFNGFDSLVQSLFNSFDPDLKITPAAGKVFNADSAFLEKIRRTEGVYFVSAVLEENVLLKYRNKQSVAIIKGTDNQYFRVTGLDTLIEDGRYKADTGIFHYGIAGRGISSSLDIGVTLYDPLFIFAPRRIKEISLDPREAFNTRYFYPTGIFSIDQEVDSKYVLVSLPFLRDLLEYNGNEASAIEIKVKNGTRVDDVKEKISLSIGSQYLVKDRFQQQEIFYKIMKAEKWAIFFILTFIIIVASFNIIGSLTMLIIDKKRDIVTLNSLGADWGKIRRIFLYEGWMISTMGAATGLILGILICWLQSHFKLVKLQGTGSFIIDHYPVIIKVEDVVYIFITVIVIGMITAWIPSRFVNRKHFNLLTR